MENLLKKAKKNSKKRNFIQIYDLIVALKGIDLKKTPIDFYATLPHERKIKVCALVGPELAEEAKLCDKVIMQDDFSKFDKKQQKKLADEFDFFIAQANMMQQVATTFGRIFGPRRKMPNPKAGCVVPPKANLQPLIERLRKTLRITAKSAMIQTTVGTEEMPDSVIVDNLKSVYDQIIHHLPNEKNNIKVVYLKTTMGKPARLGVE